MTEHIILVAFDVDSLSRTGAHLALQRMLPRPGTDDLVGDERVVLDSWWVAEDDRHDGSDNDSAVFVPMGTQDPASRFLFLHGYTPGHNVVNGAGRDGTTPGLPDDDVLPGALE